MERGAVSDRTYSKRLIFRVSTKRNPRGQRPRLQIRCAARTGAVKAEARREGDKYDYFLNRRGSAPRSPAKPAMTERHRELPVRTEVGRVAEGSAVGDRFAGHVALQAILNGRRRFFLLENKIYARVVFEALKALPIRGWAGAVFHAGLEDKQREK
jgi:hypothetical protein